MPIAFIPNEAGIREFLGSKSAVEGMSKAGDVIVGEAERNAPVGVRGFPHYRDTLGHDTPAVDSTGSLVMHVGSDDTNAALIEFGSVNNPPYRTVTHATQECGLKVTDPGPS
jgi:hypothetical protein